MHQKSVSKKPYKRHIWPLVGVAGESPLAHDSCHISLSDRRLDRSWSTATSASDPLPNPAEVPCLSDWQMGPRDFLPPRRTAPGAQHSLASPPATPPTAMASWSRKTIRTVTVPSSRLKGVVIYREYPETRNIVAIRAIALATVSTMT